MNIKEKIRTNRKIIIAMLAIMIVGIFLRTYGYSELLRFGKDQARDAAIVRDIIQNNESWPLLGPKAGGTDFKMGPIFYYFQLASASIFGVAPDKMAYPDLLFSIITLPVLFLFLRKYFNAKMSLALTALYSVSFFAVQNSRFAWNPNSLPLFSILFLYAFLQLADPKINKNLFWAMLVGLAIGIGVQLHTLYILITLPTLFIFSIYLIRKKTLAFKSLLAVLVMAIFLNIPQIMSEAKTNFQNTRDFFSGINVKSQDTIDLQTQETNKLLLNSAWHIQANSMFLAPLSDDGRSDLLKAVNKLDDSKKGAGWIKNNIIFFFWLIFGVIFSLAGYVSLAYFTRHEKDELKKNFLRLVSLYVLLAFAVLWPLAHVLALRYFLILQFVPFLFLGLLIKFLREKFGKKLLYGSYGAIALLAALNIYSVGNELSNFKNGKGDVGIAIWSEEKFAGEFISARSDPFQKIQFIYEPQNANKFIRPLAYFNETIDAPLVPNDGTPPEDKNAAIFSLILNKKKEINMWKRKIEKSDYQITGSAAYGRLAIYELELKRQNPE